MEYVASLQQQFYEMLLESQWWSRAELVAYQRSQLAQLLRHARTQVPFYENRLSPVFTRNDGIDWDRWTDLPITTRSDLQIHRDAMQARQLPPGHGETAVFTSSGSTGNPVSVTVNGLTTLANLALGWRYHRWNDLDWSAPLARWQLLADELPPGEVRKEKPWGPPWATESTGPTWGVRKDHETAAMVDFLKASGCRYVNRGPKAMHAFALECERLNLSAQVDVVLTQGEGCDDVDRAIFRRVLGARAVELYSAKEGGHIAHPCKEGTLHVAEETVLVEVLDEDNRPCPAGVSGRVTITPLTFTAQPLIRYQLGDIATMGEPCICGRPSRTLAQVLGRATAIFTHPDGRAICRFLPSEGKQILKCGLWQLAQIGPQTFEIRYVPANGEADRNAFDQLFRSIFFSDAELRFRPVPELTPTKAGKYVEYVNETSA